MPEAPDFFSPLLRRIADVLLVNGSFVGNWGLLRGKTGIAVFLYHYARYSGREVYAEFAGELIEDILTQIDQGSPVHYADGLSGFGVGVEYLVHQQFIEANTAEVLESVDALVRHHSIYHTPETLWMDYGVTGLGKYFAARFKNPYNLRDSAPATLLKEDLSLIVDLLDKSYSSYPVLLGVMDLLSDACALKVNEDKARDYLRYTADKLETMVQEDAHFGHYPGAFHPLDVGLMLFRAAERTGMSDFSERAQWVLNRYETDLESHQSEAGKGIQSGPLRYALQYHCLNQIYPKSVYAKKSEFLLNKALTEHPEALAGIPVENRKGVPELGLMSGYAGAGMALLTLSGSCSAEWTQLLSS